MPVCRLALSISKSGWIMARAAHRVSAVRASPPRAFHADHTAPATRTRCRRHGRRHCRRSCPGALRDARAAVATFHVGRLPFLTRSGGTGRRTRTMVLRSTSNCSARALSANVCIVPNLPINLDRVPCSNVNSREVYRRTFVLQLALAIFGGTDHAQRRRIFGKGG
jgi:hypothetical protein